MPPSAFALSGEARQIAQNNADQWQRQATEWMETAGEYRVRTEQAERERDAALARVCSTLESPEMVERLAALAHEQWSGWTRWMIDKWSPEFVARWERQIATPYDQLSEREKESDRKEARRVLEAIHAALGQARQGVDNA